jgi:hypothetical protein
MIGIQNSNRSAITSSLWEKRVNFHKQQLAQFANTGGTIDGFILSFLIVISS